MVHLLGAQKRINEVADSEKERRVVKIEVKSPASQDRFRLYVFEYLLPEDRSDRCLELFTILLASLVRRHLLDALVDPLINLAQALTLKLLRAFELQLVQTFAKNRAHFDAFEILVN